MMLTLSEPLTPAHCDLRSFGFMPFDVSRLLRSDFFFKATGDEFKAAIALWSQSWWQLPAASLPNDDVVLAGLASVAKAKWKRIKAMALYGWVLCSDGRWYHPVLADKALEAMPMREQHQEKRSADAERKERERQSRKDLFALLRTHGMTPAFNITTSELRELAKPFMSLPPVTQAVTPLVTEDVTGRDCDMSHPVTAKTETLTLKETKTETETETETKNIKPKQQAAARTQPIPDLSHSMSQPMSQTLSQPMSQDTSRLPVSQDTEQQRVTHDATQLPLPYTSTGQMTQAATSTTQAAPVTPLSGTRIGLLCQKLRSQIPASPAAFAKPGWHEVLAALDDEFIMETVRAKRLANPNESYGIHYFLPGLLQVVKNQRDGIVPVDPRGRPDPFNLSNIDRSADAARMEACLKRFNIVINDDTPLDF